MPTVKELRKIASGLKIPGRSKMNKAALIIAISASRKSKSRKRKSRKRKNKSRKRKNKSRKRTPKKKSRRGQSKKGKKSRRRHKFRLGARDETFKKLHKPFIYGNYTANDVEKIYKYLVSGLAQKVYIERVKKYNEIGERGDTQAHINPPKTPRQLLINVLKTAKDSYISRRQGWRKPGFRRRPPRQGYTFPTWSTHGGRETDSFYAKDESGVGLLVAAGRAIWGGGRGRVDNKGRYVPKYLLGAAPHGKGPEPESRYENRKKVLNSIRLQPVEINALLKYAERQKNK